MQVNVSERLLEAIAIGAVAADLYALKLKNDFASTQPPINPNEIYFSIALERIESYSDAGRVLRRVATRWREQMKEFRG